MSAGLKNVKGSSSNHIYIVRFQIMYRPLQLIELRFDRNCTLVELTAQIVCTLI